MNEYGIKKSDVILNSPQVTTVRQSSRGVENHLRDRFNIENKSLIFLYIGVLEHGRGIEKYLKAFSDESHTHHLVFLGSGSLESRIHESMKTNSRIHVHEPVMHDQVIKVAQNADFGLCLIDEVSMSDWLCLPNKFFEYAFAGLPIIASDFPEMSEAVQSNSLGIAIGSSNEEFQTLLRNSNELRRIQVLVRDADLSELSLEIQRTRFASIFFNH
jgi:glycosyltransferase involved in cell wall biosynthesis